MDMQLTFKFIDDLPIHDASRFNFDRIVSTLVGFITNHHNQAPFNICIDGSWGTGKTSLMQTLARRLEAESKNQSTNETRNHIPLWFEPWKLSKEADVLNALVNLVLRKIESNANLFASALIEVDRKDALRLLSQRFLEINPDEISAYYHWASRLSGSFVEIEDLFRRVTKAYLGEPQPRRIFVVFIDDLDRCPPSRVVAVLEAIKLFFNMQGFIFVLGIDLQQVTAAVLNAYQGFSESDARIYLEKMFQMVYTLPVKEEQSLISFVSNEMLDMGLTIQDQDLLRALIDTFGRNLRNLKIFLNNFNFQRHLVIQPDQAISDEILFKWLYVETMLPSTLNQAIRLKSLDFLVSLEFIARGALLSKPKRRSEYIQFLAMQPLQHVPLIIWSILQNEKLSDVLDISLLNTEQARFVDTLRRDGRVANVLKLLGRGTTFFFDQDLSQIAYLTRREELVTDERTAHPEKEKDAAAPPAFSHGFILPKVEWDRLGDRLIRDKAYQEGYLAYLAALLQDFSEPVFWTDVGVAFRRLDKINAAKAAYKQAYKLNPEYVNLMIEIGFLWDTNIDDDYIASLFYRKVMMSGVALESVPFNLAYNLKMLGDLKRAFYFALMAYSNNPEDKPNQNRVISYSKPIGLEISRNTLNPELANQLLQQEEAEQLLHYPLDEQEEEKIRHIIESFPELGDAEEEIRLVF